MLHIAHLTTVHHPFDTRIFQKECRTLVQAGYVVTLVAPHSTQEIVDGVEIVPIPGLTDRMARRTRFTRGIRNLYRVARHLDTDLYHFHDPELLPVGILLKLTTRAAVVYDVHENHAKKIRAREWIAPPAGWAASLVVKTLEMLAASLVDGIVTVTEHIAAPFPAHKTRVVKNYPPLSMIKTSGVDERKYEGNHTLIYTGGFTNHRGIEQIVQALEYVETPTVRLTLLGRRIDRGAEERVRAMPGFDRVDYLGHVSYETMYHHLSTAAIGLVCNQPVHDYHLSQPNKLFEYLSAGLPVIASDFPLWREVVEQRGSGLNVDTTNPKEIAKAIDYLLARPDLRRTMGKNGRKAAQETYNWKHEGEKLVALYKEILNQC